MLLDNIFCFDFYKEDEYINIVRKHKVWLEENIKIPVCECNYFSLLGKSTNKTNTSNQGRK